ncbi:MAG: tRNA lysidine(34) synthetase TilS [Candidatus Geothermincolia bacterium]
MGLASNGDRVDLMAHLHGGNLPGKARSTISRYGMLAGGERVVVSVSGGPDSVALLLFLTDISPELNLTLSVFHLDHMLRGEESRQDAAFVQGLADRLGVPAEVMAADVRAESEGSRRSPQDAARIVRLERLLDYADRWGADRVAVGHTADDQVETFLMRMIQGAGLTGLAAIGAVSGKIVRPLIEVWRYEIELYLQEKQITARTDRTNLEVSYLRNRVRHNLLPCIISEFGVVTKEVILREVESLALDRELFQQMARCALDEVGELDEGRFRVNREALKSLSPSLQRGVIREVWMRLMPGEPMLSSQHVADVMERILEGATGAAIDLPRGTVAEREYDDVVIGPREPEAEALEPVSLDVPGEARLTGGVVIEAVEVDSGKVAFDGDATREFVRPGLKLPLEIRGPRPGDRFRPLGSPYQRKLKDYFIDVKLPRRERSTVPLVLEDGHVVWVAGQRLDDRYKVRPGDRTAILLRLRREGE